MKICVICGGERRTGTKYCHKCRSVGRYGKIEKELGGEYLVYGFYYLDGSCSYLVSSQSYL